MRKFLKFVLLFIFLFVLVLLYSRFVGTKGLIIKEYKVVNSKIIDNYHGLKIVHISDIHYATTIFENEMQKLVDKINEIKPDVIVFTGDLVDDSITEFDAIIANYLNNMKANLGKYAISGNHDNIEQFNKIIENTDFTNLNDTYELIYNKSNQPIVISGISSNYFDSSKIGMKTESFDNYMANLNADDIKPIYSILLIHEPDFIDNINKDNYDLILSGHSHAGQIRIPFIGKIYTPYGAKNYYDEYYRINNSDLFISSGLGTSKTKLRLFNKPSFNFYRITNK